MPIFPLDKKIRSVLNFFLIFSLIPWCLWISHFFPFLLVEQVRFQSSGANENRFTRSNLTAIFSLGEDVTWIRCFTASLIKRKPRWILRWSRPSLAPSIGHSLHTKNKRTSPLYEVVIERPLYDLTIFKVHFVNLTIKMYSKGEQVLRIKILVYNTKQLRFGKRIDRFPQITASLKEILDRFVKVLRSVDVSFIDNERLYTWPLPSKWDKPESEASMSIGIECEPWWRGVIVNNLLK